MSWCGASSEALPGERNPVPLRVLLVCGFLWAAAGGAAEPAAVSNPGLGTPARGDKVLPLVRLGFSLSHFAGVNRNDALAALRVYAQNMATESHYSTDGSPVIMEGTDAIVRALRLQEVDLLSVTTEEFLAVEENGAGPPLLMTGINREVTEEYLLLVHDDSPVRKVPDLQGCTLFVSSDVRASLARLWLEVLCLEHGCGVASEVLKKITPAPKPALAVLPVFFRQTDACVVTRNAFSVMAELNPQLAKQLRVVAFSPRLVPALSCFRRELPEALKQRIVETAVKSHTFASFKQLTALFKTGGVTVQPPSVLDSARELVATHRRLLAARNSPATGTAPLGPDARPVLPKP